MDLKSFYKKRTQEFAERADFLKAKYNRFSVIRLIAFIGGGILIIVTGTMVPLWATALIIVMALIAFSKFVFWHQAIHDDHLHHNALSEVNQNELKCVNDDYSIFEDGKEFLDPSHSYAVDLDIFGAFSFFQYINRTSTAIGKLKLAKYLKTGVSRQEISSRQIAIEELKEKTDWRHHFQAKGMNTKDNLHHVRALEAWMNEQPFVSNNKLYSIAPYLSPLIIIAGAIITFYYFSWYVFLLFLLPSAYILKKTLEQVGDTHQQTSKAEKILAYYARMIEHIESESFESPKLKELQSLFFKNEQTASLSIKRLSYIIAQLNVRYNAFVIMLNLFVLWDLIWIKALENWKATNSKSLLDWFEGLQEFEALNSFGNLYYNNSSWIFPEITENSNLIGIELGHPLIPAEKRVCNDLKMPTQAHIKLVTGSNMAGKSTFLRTIGLNIVLAMTGSPVCAKKFELPLMRVFTSMRTQDALHESTSSFYAELKRLKFIIEEVEERKNSEPDIFFLLDEILKGTNSVDRHTGSKALIRQLIKSKGSGIIATHDLELAALEAESNGTVENLCIEVEVKDDKLFFDYTIKPGVSKSFNATQLMRSMGIRIDQE
jgi:DNA mismatch repair ATPase MutS